MNESRWSVLRHRPFVMFCGGSFISTTGIYFTTVAIAWQIYDLTGSAFSLGIIGLSQGVPQVIVTLFGGAMADAFDRRRLMMAVQAANIIFSIGLVILTTGDAITAPLLVVFSGLFATTNALENPSRQAIVTNILPVELIPAGVAFNNTLRNLAVTLGPALAGLVLALGGPAWCYGLDLVSWLAMLAGLIALGSGLSRDLPIRPSIPALVEGARFVASKPVIFSFMALDFGATFFGTTTALLPIYAKDVFEVGATGLGILYAAPSLGAVLAGIALTFFSSRSDTGRFILLGVAVYAAGTIGFGLSTLFPLSVAFLILVGAGNAVSATMRQTSIQLLTPGRMRGRVSAVTSILWGGQWGQIESGFAAQLGGARFSAVSSGIGALFCVAIVSALPYVRNFKLDEARNELTSEEALLVAGADAAAVGQRSD